MWQQMWQNLIVKKFVGQINDMPEKGFNQGWDELKGRTNRTN